MRRVALLAVLLVMLVGASPAEDNPDCGPTDDALGCAAACLANCGGGWVEVALWEYYQHGTDVVCNCTCVGTNPGFQQVCVQQPGGGGPTAPPRDPAPSP